MMETNQPVGVVRSCTLCGKKFANKQNINRHMKNIHAIKRKPEADNKASNFVCPLCKFSVFSSTILFDHFKEAHQIQIKNELLKFQSFMEFKKWKENFEIENKCQYVASRLLKKKESKSFYYNCHRSGVYKPKLKNDTRQRALKMKGSNKINTYCPASIIATTYLKTGKVTIDHIITHVGHDFDIRTLRLPKEDRNKIAGQLLQGIPNHRILKNIESQFDPNARVSYTTVKDLNNIKSAYNIESGVIFHSDDAQNIDIMVKNFQESNDNPLLAYKPYGIEDSEGTFAKNNFFLIFMNKVQQDLLNMYGNQILMIDSTHGTNNYNIQLTTLMVLDEDYEGFPVAFMWSVIQTKEMYKIFFSHLKEKVPTITPAVFISDDCSAYYKAFTDIYSCFPRKLLCDWHVKRNLLDNLLKITGIETRKEIKKKLYALINELDEGAFEKSLQSFLNSLISEDTEKYLKYFTTFYVKRKEEWAHCYRKGLHRNTNMALKKWHQEITHNARMQEKCQTWLDKNFNNIIVCLRQKFFKRLVSISRNKVPHYLNALRERHKRARDVWENIQTVEEIPSVQWQVQSSKNNKELQSFLNYYCVKLQEENADCTCKFFCDDCSMCLHRMSCTCPDYQLKFNMCKHIHVICKKFLVSNNTRESEEIKCSNNEKFNIISSQLSIENQDTKHNDLFYQKQLALKKISELADIINTTTDVNTVLYISKKVSILKAGSDAIASQGHLKNIT